MLGTGQYNNKWSGNYLCLHEAIVLTVNWSSLTQIS